MDELNDETFGCDLADINDDWEEVHEKLAGVDGPNVDSDFFNLSQPCKLSQPQNDDIHPLCEDLVKKSISNFILDDLYDDISSDFNSFQVQNEVASTKTKVDKKSINLDTLRPPSPSILPFDDTFMSSVWRPLSPEFNIDELNQQKLKQQQEQEQQQQQQQNQHRQQQQLQQLQHQLHLQQLQHLQQHHHQQQQQQQLQQQLQRHDPAIANIGHVNFIQAQRNYNNNFSNNRKHDKYSGFMTQREKDWLIKIFRLQCKVNDPYVEDYYEVNFKVKKATNERRKNLATQQNKDVDDEEIDTIIENDPMIVLPELAKMEEEKPKYIQFDNTLGKIQVLNTKCPRKLLDMNPDKPNGDSSSSNSFYGILGKIEILYEHLLNIEDEDKRIPILPEHIKPLRLELRDHLCQQLYEGIVQPIAVSQKGGGTTFALINRSVPTLVKLDSEIDHEILSVSKGAILVYRSLQQLRKEDQFVVLLCSLVKSANYKQLIAEAENNAHLNIGNMLIKALARIKEARNLIYITAAMDDIELIVLSKVRFEYFHNICHLKTNLNFYFS